MSPVGGACLDWQPYLDIDLTRIFETPGRSITMATGLNLDQIKFFGYGNEV
jgi:hypothetical protein